MSSAFKSFFLTILCVLFICGCSGADGPATPAVADQPSPATIEGQGTDIATTPQVPEGSAEQKPGHWLWAYEQIYIDPGNMEFEVIPQRLVTGHWNVLTWLENGPCTDCFQLVGLTPSGSGTLLADIEVTHPFALLNFTGFDVRGIAMFTGSKTFPDSGLTTPDRLAGDGELVNADGYTTLYNSTTEGSGPDGLQGYQKGNLASVTPPDAFLNGYKRHITDNPVNTRNAFYAGDSIMATYEVDMPDGPFIFGYAVDASWTKPLTTPVTDPMTQFGPDANCPEPWKIEISEEPVGQGLTDQGGETVLTVDVYDWQGKDSHYDPVLECPELFNGSANAAWVEDGTGYARYEVTIQNQSLAGEGEYECLIKVEDTENAGSPDWLDLTSYQIYTLEVGEYQVEYFNPSPCAEVDPNPAIVCEDITFDGSCSFDPDGGDIVSWEWDWDGDGVFDDEGEIVVHAFDVVGTYFVDLRVTDDEGAMDALDKPIEVLVENALPTAVAQANTYNALVGDWIDFDGTGSHENDCGGQAIVLYEWDFDFDGSFDSVMEGPTPTVEFNFEGTYQVQLRVTDDENGTDMLDEPLEIVISTIPPPWVIFQNCVDPIDSPNYTFVWAMGDDNTPSYELKVTIWKDSDGPAILADGTLFYEWVGIGCGPHSFTVEVENNAGLTDSEICEFVFPDDESPEVNIANCPPSTGASYPFDWTMHDNCTSPSDLAVEIRKNGGSWESLPNGTDHYTWENISCHDQVFDVRVEDEVGYSNWDSCVFDGPDDPPELNFTNCPIAGDFICTSSYLFQWEFSDDCTANEDMVVHYKKDGGSWEPSAGPITSYMWSGIGEGDHTLAVKVTDESANETIRVCGFYADVTDPIVAWNYPDTTYNQPCIHAYDARLSYDPFSGDFTYEVTVLVNDETGFEFVRLDVGDFSETQYPTGTSALVDFEWVFSTADADSGYKWDMALTVKDGCGHMTVANKEVFTIFMPGWPSGDYLNPSCGTQYDYWEDGKFQRGWSPPPGTQCRAIQTLPYAVRIFEMGADGGIAFWFYNVDKLDWGDPISLTALQVEGSTCCEGDCNSGDWQIGIWNYDSWLWEWTTPGPVLDGCHEWDWPRAASADYFNDLGTDYESLIAISVDTSADTFDGLRDFFIGFYMER